MKKLQFMFNKIFIISYILLMSSCVSMRKGSLVDANISLNQYQLFSWISKVPLITYDKKAVNISPLTKKIIKDSITEALLIKGYQYLPHFGKSDFVLSYTKGTREKIKIESYPYSYRGNCLWYWECQNHSVSNWHSLSWTEGTLMIDIFDNQSKESIWHGWPIKSINDEDRNRPSNTI